jgi:hypothetical protein
LVRREEVVWLMRADSVDVGGRVCEEEGQKLFDIS